VTRRRGSIFRDFVRNLIELIKIVPAIKGVKLPQAIILTSGKYLQLFYILLYPMHFTLLNICLLLL